MRNIFYILNALALMLVGCYVLVDVRIGIGALVHGSAGTDVLGNLIHAPLRVLYLYPFADIYTNFHILEAYLKAPREILFTMPQFVRVHVAMLVADILVLLLVALAIYYFERRSTKTTRERTLFYLIVPPVIWFLYAFILL